MNAPQLQGSSKRLYVDYKPFQDSEGNDARRVDIQAPYFLEEEGADEAGRVRYLVFDETDGVLLGTLLESEEGDQSLEPAEGVEIAAAYHPDIDAPETRTVHSVQLFREDNEEGDNRALVGFIIDGEESGLTMHYELESGDLGDRWVAGEPTVFGSDRLSFEFVEAYPDEESPGAGRMPSVYGAQVYRVKIDGEVVGALRTFGMASNGEQQYFEVATDVKMDWSLDDGRYEDTEEEIEGGEFLEDLDYGPKVKIISRRAQLLNPESN